MIKRKDKFSFTVALLSMLLFAGMNSQAQQPVPKTEVLHVSNGSAKPLSEDIAIENARSATQLIIDSMPDFMAQESVVRSYASGLSKDWIVRDRLTVSVTYQSGIGEQYKLLTLNGNPVTFKDYDDVSGLLTAGEFVTCLSDLFSPYSRTRFWRLNKEYIRGKETLVYAFNVDLQFSQMTIQNSLNNTFNAGYKGKIWLDSKTYQVLRYEEQITEVPKGFTFYGYKMIDYDFVKIGESNYLLPSNVIVETSHGVKEQAIQSRNEIRFTEYRKYGAELRIIDDEE
jgi:hypothetical protein